MAFDLTSLGDLLDLDTGSSPTSSATIPVTILGQGDTFSQARNTVRRYQVTFLDPGTEQPLSGIFAGTEALRAFVWEGGSGPALATPAVSWDDGATATVYLDVAPTDLAGLAIQPYPVRVEVDRGGQWQEAWDGWADVLAETATTSSPMAPGTYQDMLDHGGNEIKQLLTIESGAGFLRERALAWTYLRAVILARYRPPGGNRYGSFYATGLPGYSVSADYPNPVIAGYLDAGYLIVTDLCREILARKAMAKLFDRQTDPAWKAKAKTEHLRADWLICSYVAGIDLIGNGYPTITINCGVANTRDI